MKKLINLIFAEKQQEPASQPEPWSFERNGWESSAKLYNKAHGLKSNEL